ncbi:MAG: HlyD family efflux transporter periplasmic adaptor subunit, partial [Gammaproteobacteria bacterium]|nr:HlyD family efflux transporter periplasmic adaptor subunit [Gammaproteobacteria bacterium]
IAASKLRAQFDGTITEHGIQPGEWASPGREVIRVVNLAAKEVLARTALENIRFLKTGDELEISDGKNTGKVQLAAMVPIGEISDGVYELRFSLLSGDWRVGQSLSIKVPQSQSSSVLTIPRDAILLRSGGSSIIRLIDDSSFERINVQTGLGNTDRIEVKNSEKQLTAGDRVIIRGGERLQDGQEFVIKN